MSGFKRAFYQFKNAFTLAKNQQIDFKNFADKKKTIADYEASKRQYYYQTVLSSLKQLKESTRELHELISSNPGKKEALQKAIALVDSLNILDFPKTEKSLTELETLFPTLPFSAETMLTESTTTSITIHVQKIPIEIRDDVLMDIREMEKCYLSGCYRSCVIICGRILEAVLHRKYFDATGQDILEKNPGIGLGTLIAKLREKNVEFDPGLTEQIHLVNQVRVFCVHKKQTAFYPSKAQAQAMMLYTQDIIEKTFK